MSMSVWQRQNLRYLIFFWSFCYLLLLKELATLHLVNYNCLSVGQLISFGSMYLYINTTSIIYKCEECDEYSSVVKRSNELNFD